MSEVYVRDFETFAGNGGLEGPSWLPRVRRSAIDRFAAVGFPSPRDEEWRFTPVGPIAQGEFRPAGPAVLAPEALDPFLFGHQEWLRLVFVNGRPAPELSLSAPVPAGVRFSTLAAALRTGGDFLERHLTQHALPETTPFAALNTAFLRDGGLLHVAADTDVPHPIHLVFLTSPTAAGSVAHPRNLIVVERGARVSIVESYVSLAPDATYLTNGVTEVVSGEGAWVEHIRIQRESERAYHVGLTQVAQERASHYRSFSLAVGGAIARHNLHVRLNGSGAETLLYGLYLTRGEQLLDNHTAIHHDHPNCKSWEVYKGVLDGRSRAVFNGKVFVKPEAQKTDAKQTNRNLLLSDGAKVNTKPQLEIFADDVKCTHGATVGFLDPMALFYLRSRGVPSSLARKILTYGFAAEVVNEVRLEPVRRELDRLILDRLGFTG